MTRMHTPPNQAQEPKVELTKRPALKQMLARFDPAVHGGEFMPGAPVGREALSEAPKRPKRPAKA